MKNRYIYIITVILLAFLGFSSCSDDDCDAGSIYDNIRYPEKNEVDKWIIDNYITEYNIEVLYRWKDVEADFTYDVVPVRADTVVSYLKMLEKIWLKAYIDLTSASTMKPIFPKQCLLIGSSAWEDASTTVEGTAEGGRKIVLYSINEYDPKDSTILKDYAHVVHHEFAHILNQKMRYNFTAFKNITPEDYTSSWGRVSGSEALALGFVSSYAMSEPDEDFVEVLSFYIIRTPQEWETLLSSTSDIGRQKIEAKLGLVRAYMEEFWKIDLNNLRDAVLNAIQDVQDGNY